MGDDGIALKILWALKDKFMSMGIEPIFGETDVDFCIDSIHEGDIIFIIDSSFQNQTPGTVKVTQLCETADFVPGITQHGLNLIKMIRMYFECIQGYIITVEAENIYPCEFLSPTLKMQFSDICNGIDKINYSIILTYPIINKLDTTVNNLIPL